MKNEIEFKFGDYAIIEQKRHGVPNEMFVHKVVGQLRSNTWVDVPVQSPATETMHDEMEDVCLCICCGVDETEVRRYRVKDMRHRSLVSAVSDEKKGSTITLQAVNELIASLESAGELSIREQKFLKLAKEFTQLAAENVALKSFGDKLNDMHNALNGEGTGIQGRAEVACQQVALEAAMEEFDAIETPATDAVLTKLRNEAGARAVELFAKTLGSPYRFRDEQCYEDGFTRAIEIVRFAQAPLFARQLRDGGK